MTFAKLQKLLDRSWIQWLIAGICGAALSLGIWIIKSSYAVGQATAQNDQQWKQNDTEHREFKQMAQTVETRLGRMEGKLDLLIQQRQPRNADYRDTGIARNNLYAREPN